MAQGRRREIPGLWAFLLIGQILPVSFAQNLFFLAMLLIPIPSSDAVKPTPKPALQLSPLVPYFLSTFLAPFLVGTGFFVPVIFTVRLLLFCPLLIPFVLPRNVMTTRLKRKDFQRVHQGAYRFIAISSAVLITTQTIVAIRDNLPAGQKIGAPKQNSSMINDYAGVGTATVKVLGAINDNPAVSALAYDYILSVISFLMWYLLI